MKIFPKINIKTNFLLVASLTFLCSGNGTLAQEQTMGEQNGTTWRSLVIGTPAETLSRKTFYVDGLDCMSAFWSQHTDLKPGAVDFNRVFIDMNVGRIRDGLDSFYVDGRNLHVPIIDAILIIRLQDAHVGMSMVDDVVIQFRGAAIKGPDPEREKEIWQGALKLLK